MDTPNVPLEIHVHLEDGRQAKFVQKDEETAHKFLASIKPGKLFAEPVLVFSDSQTTIAFQSAKVVRIDFITKIAIDWPFPMHVKDSLVLSKDEFELNSLKYKQAQDRPAWMQGDRRPIPVVAEMELVNGAIIFLESHVQPDHGLPLDQSLFLHRIFSSGGVHSRLKEGMMVVNPASIARFAFYHGTMTVPSGAWQATAL